MTTRFAHRLAAAAASVTISLTLLSNVAGLAQQPVPTSVLAQTSSAVVR